MAVHINQLPQSVKDKLGLKDTAYKQFWAIIGNKPAVYFRSTWEYYYAIFLEKLERDGKIVGWKHEPKTFWFEKVKRGVRSYLPDFCVTHLNGDEEWCEVKGLMDNKSKTKLKRMNLYYPEIKLRVVGSDWFRHNLKSCKALEPLIVKKKFDK